MGKRPTPYTPTFEEFNAFRAQLAAALDQRDALRLVIVRAHEIALESLRDPEMENMLQIEADLRAALGGESETK